MTTKFDWEMIDQATLTTSMACIISELDALEVIIYAADHPIFKTTRAEILDDEQEICFMKELLKICDSGEVIKFVDVNARKYLVHGINLSTGCILGLIYTNDTPYSIARKQSTYLLGLLINLNHDQKEPKYVQGEFHSGSSISLPVPKKISKITTSSDALDHDGFPTNVPNKDVDKQRQSNTSSRSDRDLYTLTEWM